MMLEKIAWLIYWKTAERNLDVVGNLASYLDDELLDLGGSIYSNICCNKLAELQGQ